MTSFKFKKSWYINPPDYGTPEWWRARMAYEGEHMKALYDNYFIKFFPSVSLEFFSTAECNFASPNIIYNKVSSPFSDRTYL